MSNSLWPHELQHTRPPCPSPNPGVHPNSCASKSVMPSSHLILCRPLLFLPPIPPSIRAFSNESILHMRWSKYWSFSFSISLLQHHSSKASILRRSAFFTVQLSHTYTTTGKTIPLTRWTLYCQRNVSAFEYAI